MVNFKAQSDDNLCPCNLNGVFAKDMIFEPKAVNCTFNDFRPQWNRLLKGDIKGKCRRTQNTHLCHLFLQQQISRKVLISKAIYNSFKPVLSRILPSECSVVEFIVTICSEYKIIENTTAFAFS
jgi:hypothetical protein